MPQTQEAATETEDVRPFLPTRRKPGSVVRSPRQLPDTGRTSGAAAPYPGPSTCPESGSNGASSGPAEFLIYAKRQERERGGR